MTDGKRLLGGQDCLVYGFWGVGREWGVRIGDMGECDILDGKNTEVGQYL